MAHGPIFVYIWYMKKQEIIALAQALQQKLGGEFAVDYKKSSVVIECSGETLGYDDGHTYEWDWEPKSKTISTATFEDRAKRNIITADTCSEDIATVDEAAHVILNHHEHEWGG